MLHDKKFLFAVPVLLLVLFLVGIAVLRTDNSHEIAEIDKVCVNDSVDSGLITYRIHSNEVFEVCLAEKSEDAAPVELINSPGIYSIDFHTNGGSQFSINVNASEPGLYRFFYPDIGSRQFLVWTTELGLEALLADLSYVYVHGNTDDNLTVDELVHESQKRVISITCGTISRLLQNLLIPFDIKSRLAVSVTLEELNQLDDGHIMLEVYKDSEWILIDPDSRTLFGTRDKPLGVSEIDPSFSPLVGRNIMPYAPLLSIDVGGFQTMNGIDLTFLEQKSRVSNKSLSKWYERVLGKIGIQKDPYFWFSDIANDEERQRIRYFYPTAQFVSIEQLTK